MLLFSCSCKSFEIFQKKIIRLWKDYHIFIGTNRNELEVRSFPHGDSLPSLVHFTQPVSALSLSNSLLFVGTRFDEDRSIALMNLFFFCRDFEVAMMNLNNDTNNMNYFDGHQAPVLALNIHEEKR